MLLEEEKETQSAFEYSFEGSSERSQSSGSEDGYCPRKKIAAYKNAHGKKMKTKKNTLKFTQGTSPFEKDILNFVSGELVACPQYLPMLPEDATYTVTALQAAAHDSSVPIGEYIRKEFFHKAFTSFEKAIQAAPELIADEVRK